MVSRIERYDADINDWISEKIVEPGSVFPLEQVLNSGRRRMFLVYCSLDNSRTAVFKKEISLRGESPLEVYELPDAEAEILKNGTPYILNIRPNQDGNTSIIRISHE